MGLGRIQVRKMLDTSETREEKKSTSDTTEDRDNELEKQDNQQIELSLASLTDKASKTESLRGALSRRGLIQDTPADKAAKTDDSLVDPKTDKPDEKSTLPELSIETTSSETGRETEVDGEKDVDLAPPRASERPPFRPGAVIDTSKLPEKMKSGTGSDAWARVSPTERREVALKMRQLAT